MEPSWCRSVASGGGGGRRGWGDTTGPRAAITPASSAHAVGAQVQHLGHLRGGSGGSAAANKSDAAPWERTVWWARDGLGRAVAVLSVRGRRGGRGGYAASVLQLVDDVLGGYLRIGCLQHRVSVGLIRLHVRRIHRYVGIEEGRVCGGLVGCASIV